MSHHGLWVLLLLLALTGCWAHERTITYQGVTVRERDLNVLRRGDSLSGQALRFPSGVGVTSFRAVCIEGVSGKAALGGALVGSIATGNPLGVLAGGLSGAVADVFGGDEDALCQPKPDEADPEGPDDTEPQG